MKKMGRILSAFFIVAILVSGTVSASAAPEKSQEISVAAISPSDAASPRSDVIEVKLRATDDGRIQYRRWNATRGYWMDPCWIDLP